MPSRGSSSLGNPKHLSRFIRNRAGKTVEEIAEEDGITVDRVKDSIRTVEFKQGYHTNEYLNQNLIGIILKASPAAQDALLKLLTATKSRDVKNERGEVMTVVEPDTDAIAKGLAEYRQIAAVAQPKAGHQTNVKVGVGLNVAAGQASGSYVGLEDRMREIRQRRIEQPVLESSNVQAATIVEGELVDEDEE